MRSNNRSAVVALVLATSITLATSVWPTEPSQAASASSPSTQRTQWSKDLSHPVRCRDQKRAMCATLKVPLDYAKPNRKRFMLPVRWSTRAPATAPFLLYLDGGPGLGHNKSFLKSALRKLPEVAKKYRIAVIETRGTGASALNCPKLQRDPNAVEDVMPMRPRQVLDCGKRIGGDRKFYTTKQTVKDLNLFRRALGLSTWSIMGLSYGTLQAERFAIAYPHRTRSLVLDSVVPQDGGDAYYAAGLHESGRVMREVCAEQNCGYDPAADLSKILAEGADGVAIFNALLFATQQRPHVFRVVEAIHAAANGEPETLNRQIKIPNSGYTPAREYSAALFLATVCTDMRFPWGSSKAALKGRMKAAREGADAIDRAKLFPFDRKTARRQGFISNCQHWPATRPAHLSTGELPNTRTLVINGDWDLVTPITEAREQAARIPNSKLVVIPRWGHVAIASPQGAAAISSFLLE